MNIKDLPAQAGFTLIELLFAIALSALFLPAMVFVFSFSLGAASQGESYTQAYAIAQENMEAIYYIKENDSNWDWNNTSINTSSSTYYQPEINGSVWELGIQTSSPTEVNGYKATVEVLPVERDTATGNIVEAGSGSNDPSTREIIVTVTWNEKGEDTSIDLVSYVTKH